MAASAAIVASRRRRCTSPSAQTAKNGRPNGKVLCVTELNRALYIGMGHWIAETRRVQRV